MRKILLLSLMVCSYFVQSQSYVGFLTDNYSGVHSIISNPANIVDSRFKTDFNLFGVSLLVTNDYYEAPYGDIVKTFKKEIKLKDLGKKHPLSSNNALANVDVLGPSFMFNIAPKHSIAISSRVRGIASGVGVNGRVADIVNKEIKTTEKQIFKQGEVNASLNVWAEIGLTYATVLMNKEKHFLKGGVTLKYLQSAGNAYAHSDNVDVNYDPEGYDLTVTIPGKGSITKKVPSLDSKGNVVYGHSNHFKEGFKKYDFKLSEGATGIGADIGFVYEWRPNFEDYHYKDKEGNTLSYKNVNKYKFKLGVSVTDIVGSIANEKGGTEKTYNLNKTISRQDYKDAGGNPEELLKKMTTLTPKSAEAEKFILPTALHLNADWNIHKAFYLNFNTDISLSGKGKNEGKIANTYILTPRFETNWFSFYVPMGAYQYSGFQMGAGLRLGPLYVGSGTIISAMFGDIKAADVYLGLKIPVYQGKLKDKDGDGVLDIYDNCPKEPGPVENNGCPWPDTDGDGIPDKDDDCPKEAGLKEFNGCPDTDGDGVPDKDDDCPEVAGLKEFNGCPDTDGDGTPDNLDKCPEVAGPKENNGCPWPDSDGDGIPDKDDKCPNVPGVAENDGCPKVKEITKEDKDKLDKFARAIFFNSGRVSFQAGVTKQLDNIIKIMNYYKGSKFSIEGHTDSMGAKSSNLRLSERRAKAVLDYLVRNGISSSRLNSVGYGQDYPIASNKTRAGRAENRRVEIKLVK